MSLKQKYQLLAAVLLILAMLMYFLWENKGISILSLLAAVAYFILSLRLKSSK